MRIKKYLTFVMLPLVLGLAVSIVPHTTSAQGIGANAACHIFKTNLRIGSRTAEVATLQTRLIADGFTIPSIAAGAKKGFYGEQTSKSLREYQKSVNIKGDGRYFGPLTRASMNATCGKTEVPVASSSPAVSSAEAEASQVSFEIAPVPAPSVSAEIVPPVTIISPNGKEVWSLGSVKRITWRTAKAFSYTNPTFFEVSIESDCEGCTVKKYILATGLKNVTAYEWTIGKTLNGSTVPAGMYHVQVCMRATVTSSLECDLGNATFQVSTTPEAPSESPTQMYLPLMSSEPSPSSSPVSRAEQLEQMASLADAVARFFIK